MKYSNLKKTNIIIPKLGIGTNGIGGHNLFPNLDEKQGQKFLDEAIKQGVTFIDTADMYGFGRSEELVGKVLQNYERNSYVLATKGGQTTDGPNNNPAYLRSAVDNSLRRLQLDYIDLYYLHFYDNRIPLSESIGVLSELKKEGKIKALGVSNLTLEQLKEANTYGSISAFQTSYNLLNRSAEENLLPYCIKNSISFIPYGPLAFGILGGNYDKDFKLDKEDWRNKIPLFRPNIFKKNIEKMEQLKVIAENKLVEVSDISLAWLLLQEGVDSIIPGGKKPEHIIKNMKSLDITLTKEDMNEINIIFKD